MNNWIAIDWGTSNLRVWHMDADGTVLESRSSDRGMGSLSPAEFEGALLELVDSWLANDGVTGAVACGMVGARQGWIEAPYETVPCAPSIAGSVPAPCLDPRLSVQILPGLCQYEPTADVMRGEETQIAGYLAANPDFDGVICLPGTHTKWARVARSNVERFQTFMTGETFALYSGNSVLRHSLKTDGWDGTAFDTALSEAVSQPDTVVAKLFELRAADLLRGQKAETARARLSGLLIGQEMTAAKEFWGGQKVALIGDAKLCALYAAGLSKLGVETQIEDATRMTLSGLTAAHLQGIGS